MDMQSVLGVLGIVTRSLSEAVRSGDGLRVKRLGAWAWGLLGRCRDVGQLGSEEVGDIRELGKRAVKILVKIRSCREQGYHEGYNVGDGDGVPMQGDALHIEGQEELEGTETDDEEAEADPTIQEDEKGNLGNSLPEPYPEDAIDNSKSSTQEEPTVPHDTESQPETTAQPYPDELEAAKARLRAKLHAAMLPGHPSSSPDEGEIRDGQRREGKEEDEQESEDESTKARKHTRAMLDMIISIVGEFYGQRDLLEFRDLWDEDSEGW
jgi:hypothetical protein